MEQTIIVQAAIDYHNKEYGAPKDFKPIELTERQHANNIHQAFKDGIKWQKEQYKELLHLSAQIIDAYHIRYPDADQLLVGYTHEQLFKKLLNLRERLQD